MGKDLGVWISAGFLVLATAAVWLPISAAQKGAAPAKPPVAPVRPVTDDYFGTKVVDNYRYFEDLKNPEVQQWRKAQADYTRATLDALPGRGALVDRITTLLRSTPGLVSGLQIIGGRYYTLRTPSGAQSAKLYVRDGVDGKDRLLIDPEKLNLGLEEWLREPVESTDPRTIDTNGNPCEPYREITLLGYCCVEHKWQLAIKEALMTEKATPQVTWSGITDSYDTKPLLKATRPVRTKAMDLIPRLLDSIKISVREILAVHRQSRKGSGEAIARLLRRTQRCSSGAYPGGLLSTVSDSR